MACSLTLVYDILPEGASFHIGLLERFRSSKHRALIWSFCPSPGLVPLLVGVDSHCMQSWLGAYPCKVQKEEMKDIKPFSESLRSLSDNLEI
eukprot:6473905-Amphidinium_carterae.3